MLQDSLGFLWVGTEDGLNRFDGYAFTVFRNDAEDPRSLSNSHISALYLDPEDRLWIGTYGGGLDLYDAETGTFIHHQHDPDDPNSLSDDQILALHGTATGELWIGTRSGGLNRFDPESGEWSHFRHDPSDLASLRSDRVVSVLVDSSARLWVGTAAGLASRALYAESDGEQGGDFLQHVSDLDHLEFAGLSVVVDIAEDVSGDLWFSTAASGLRRLEVETGRWTSYVHSPDDPNSLADDQVRVVLEDSWGTLWVGTAAGLDRLDREAGRWLHYTHDPANPHSLSNDDVRSIHVDRGGGLWVGTYGAGLNRYDRQRDLFALYQADPNDPNSLSENSVWAFFQDRAGLLWIGTNGGGLNRFDPAAGTWRRHVHDPADPASLAHDSVTSMKRASGGGMWVGTGGGLDWFDPATEVFRHFRSESGNPDSLSNDTVWFAVEDSGGTLWVGTANGLNRLDRSTERFTRYFHDPEDTNSLADSNVGSFLEDRSGQLWFGTHGGLNVFDRETGRFTRYQHDPSDPKSLSHDIVFSIHQADDGTIWLGTWGGGLNRLNPPEPTGQIRESLPGVPAESSPGGVTFTSYRLKDGLPNDVVYGIVEDDRGHLWLSTNYGLSRFDPRSETFINFDARDGLQSNEFNYNAYYEGQDGEIYFGGINGFNIFYPDRVRSNPYVPPVVLTKLSQGGSVLGVGAASGSLSGVTFRWPDNDFEFEFVALSFYQAEDNQYAYLLEGYDESWNDAGRRRFGAYTNLPGGSYTLRLQGSNNDGLWNQEGIVLPITIVPPIWSTWWFRMVGLAAVVVAVALGYRLRVRRVEAHGRVLEELVATRTQELAALSSIAAIVSRTPDLEQILGDALTRTLEVTGVEAGGIYLLRAGSAGGERSEPDPSEAQASGKVGDLLEIAAHQGLTPELVAGIDNLVVGEGFSGRVVLTGKPLLVRDILSDARLTRTVVREAGFRSVAIAPILSRSRALGSLFVMTRQPYEVAPPDLNLLTAIAGQIGVAIENARLFEEEKRRAEQFRLIAEVGRRITLILDVEEMLRAVTRLVQEAFGFYHVAVGMIEGTEVVYRIGAGELWDDPQFRFKPARLKVGTEGVSGWVAASGKPLLVPDVSQDLRYVWMEGSRTRSELTVPITVKGQVIGVLDAQSDRLNAFDVTDVTVLESLAHQIGAAVENARLYENAQQTAVMEERGRLARELHDAVTQTLFSASLIAEALPVAWDQDRAEAEQLLAELRLLSRGALAEMRTLLLELRPAALVEADLGDLLRQLAEAVTGREGIPVNVDIGVRCALPPDVHVALYRIAQEALNNVTKHARANRVEISLHCPGRALPAGGGEPDSYELCIRDDGRGFDINRVSSDHLGLSIMRERAQVVGARLDIETGVGRGTLISVLWPGGTAV